MLQGEAMGTTWKLAWRGKHPDKLENKITQTLTRWERVLSTWDLESDLSRFNRSEAASEDLQKVLILAESIHDESEGAFDFRLLKETVQAGYAPFGEGADLSAIAKGFTADRVGELLKQLAIKDFVFELGGEILIGDNEWEISIEKPDPSTQSISSKLRLKNCAVATSGNYRQYQMTAGGLSSHIIDPETRVPVIRKASSVTVIAKDGATADAWATALFVHGPNYAAPSELKVIWQFLEEE